MACGTLVEGEVAMRPRLLSSLALALMLLSSSVPAQAEPKLGHRTIDLMWDCQGRGDSYTFAAEHNLDPELFGQYDLLACISYIEGIVDMNALTQGIFKRSFFCFPKRGLPNEQLIRVFIKWAEAHPELLHESRRMGVIEAFVEAFPCN